jgi:hypothetical protein
MACWKRLLPQCLLDTGASATLTRCWCCRCVDNFCRCVYHTKVYEQQQSPGRELQHRFTLNTWLCCCGGRRNNCCGATCCNEELMIDVLDQQVLQPHISTCILCSMLPGSYCDSHLKALLVTC